MGTTLNKLEYVNTTKGQIKTALNQFGAGITDETTFRNYVGKINDIYDNWEKVTDEGADLSLTPTKKGKLQLTPKGKIKQDSTEGYQLLDINAESGNKNGATWVVNEDKSITISTNGATTGLVTIPVVTSKTLEAGTYYMSGINGGTENTYFFGILVDNPTQWVVRNYNGVTQFNVSEQKTYHQIWVVIATGTNLSTPITVYPMISKTNTSQYEPYTNGPSPNPDYKQDVEVVTGDNTIMVSNGNNTETQTQLISLGDIELCKIGNYEDIIFHAVNGDLYYDSLSSEQKSALTYGKWYKHSEIGKVVLNGTEVEYTKNNTGTDSWYYQFRYTSNFPLNDSVLCNYYIKATSIINNNNTNQGISLVIGSTQWLVRIRYGTEDTMANYMNWLRTHNTEIYYILAIPTDTEITNTTLIDQLDNFEKLQSYLDTTNITSSYETGNAQMILSASALKKGGN